MDWAWWGTVALTIGGLVAAYFLLVTGLALRQFGGGQGNIGIAARSGWWFGLAAACLMPAGLFFLFYGFSYGGRSSFAATFPTTQDVWLGLVPASFDPRFRAVFGDEFETGLMVLTVLGGLALLMGLHRLFWQPWRWLRAMARQHGVRMGSMLAIKVIAQHFAITVLLALVAAIFMNLVLQTLFYLLGHAVATAFFLLPFLIGLLVLAAVSAGGRDIYDRNGRKIGRLD